MTEDDVFEHISVHVSAENCTGSITSPVFGPIKKAEQAMPEAPQMESCTESSITLVAIENGEYNINGNEWQDSPVFEELTQNTSYIFTQRKKETRSHYASPTSPEAVFSTTPDQVNESQRDTFKIYPNPAHGVLFVETVCTPSLQAENEYRITNLMGQTLMSGVVETCHGASLQQINIKNLPQGMYFITIGDMMRKFVVE